MAKRLMCLVRAAACRWSRVDRSLRVDGSPAGGRVDLLNAGWGSDVRRTKGDSTRSRRDACALGESHGAEGGESERGGSAAGGLDEAHRPHGEARRVADDGRGRGETNPDGGDQSSRVASSGEVELVESRDRRSSEVRRSRSIAKTRGTAEAPLTSLHDAQHGERESSSLPAHVSVEVRGGSRISPTTAPSSASTSTAMRTRSLRTQRTGTCSRASRCSATSATLATR